MRSSRVRSCARSVCIVGFTTMIACAHAVTPLMPNGQLVRRGDAKPFTISGGVEGLLYPSSPLGDQTVAAVVQDGVYPASGYSVNDVATETIYCLEGSMVIEANGERHTLGPGDLFMIFPGTKYRIEGKAKSIDFISPAWEKNKNRIVPE